MFSIYRSLSVYLSLSHLLDIRLLVQLWEHSFHQHKLHISIIHTYIHRYVYTYIQCTYVPTYVHMCNNAYGAISNGNVLGGNIRCRGMGSNVGGFSTPESGCSL